MTPEIYENRLPSGQWGCFTVMPPTEIKEFPVTESGLRFKEAVFEIKGIPRSPLVIHRFGRINHNPDFVEKVFEIKGKKECPLVVHRWKPECALEIERGWGYDHHNG